MATKAKNWKEYAQEIVDKFGSDIAVARFLGYAEGYRVGMWRKGLAKTEELSVIKLARWNGDDPLQILRLAGYEEMADLLAGDVKHIPTTTTAILPGLVELRDELNALLQRAVSATDPEKERKR